MAIVAKINNLNNIGRATIKSTKATIVAPNFAPKPNVALVELTDTSVVSPDNGDIITFNSTTNKFEAKPIDANNINLNLIAGGTF